LDRARLSLELEERKSVGRGMLAEDGQSLKMSIRV
jgi:hypothetical protein